MALKKYWTAHAEHTCTITPSEDGTYAITFPGQATQTCTIISWDPDAQLLLFEVDGALHKARVCTRADAQQYTVELLSTEHGHIAHDINFTPPSPHAPSTTDKRAHSPTLHAPLAGRIVRILVETEHTVEPGQPLLVIESMKMENEIRAAHQARIGVIHVHVGHIVAAGQLLIQFDDVT